MHKFFCEHMLSTPVGKYWRVWLWEQMVEYFQFFRMLLRCLKWALLPYSHPQWGRISGPHILSEDLWSPHPLHGMVVIWMVAISLVYGDISSF